MSAIEEVAEAKCSRNRLTFPENGPPTHEGCEFCQGTNLRWPTLSREIGEYVLDAKDAQYGFGDHHWVVTGRVPDVTLEKVTTIIARLYDSHSGDPIGRLTARFYGLVYVPTPYMVMAWWLRLSEAERLEAACDALLRG